MSHQLNFELNRILVHMETVLDLCIDRSVALQLIASAESKIAALRVCVDADASHLEILEEDAEHLSEQVT